MAQTTPPTITGAPAVPQRGDRATFSGRVDAFITWLSTAVAEFGAVATNVYNNAVDAYNSAVASAASAGNAATSESNANLSALAAASSAGAPLWVTGSTYALGAATWSPANRVVYRKITASSVSNTDPSADPTNWAILGTLGLTLVTVSGTSQPAVAGTHYILTNVAATNVTLPAGTSGDTVWITWTNSLATNTVTPNGAETIMDVAGAMALDASTKGTVQLRYVASSWRIM